ncbi:MAG TPA: D-alanyl-D-alanine carboxypeptidase, partial [Armatimonadota bacterium]
EIFLSSLPIAGVDGTLRNRMKDSPAQGNVMAKTGSMTRVVCLSGFVRAGNGENLVFSFMLNNYCCTMKEAMDVEDSILKTLAGSDLKPN